MSQGRTAVSFTGVSLGKNTRLRTVSRLRVSGLEQSHRPGGLMAPGCLVPVLRDRMGQCWLGV